MLPTNKKFMKILLIITLSELGGAQTVVVNLANKLSENHEVIVAAGEVDGKMFDFLSSDVKIERIPSLVRRISPLNELKTIIALRKIYKKYTPDIIHLHSSKAGLLGRLALPSKKIVYTVHGFDSIRIAYRKFLIIEKILQYKCAAIVGVSRYDETNLISEGIKNNVSTVYNGIYKPNHQEFNPFEHLVNYKHKILCIARLSPQKNPYLFIEVAKKLPDCAFVWIGNLSDPSFEFPENVFFLGNIPNAGSFTEYADLFMLPSNYEGLPMVIIESLSMGTPVIASDVGGISELLNGENGWAVSNDPNIMASMISKYLSLPSQERRKISIEAISTYERKFTINNMTEGYLEVYNRILDSNKCNG